MASIFDQYAKEATISTGFVPGIRPLLPEMTSGGIINARLEDDTPIFKKQKINYHPTSPVSHLVAASNVVVFTMKNKVLLRIDLQGPNPEIPEEIELTRSLPDKSFQAKVYQLFIDPRGQHLIASVVYSANMGHFSNLYIGPGYSNRTNQAQEITKMKGHVISAVGWNFANKSDSSTSFILLGTTKGLVFETELTGSEDRHFFSNFEKYCKPVFDFQLNSESPKVPGLEDDGPITAIEFHQVDGCFDKRYFILVTTPSRLYELVGSATQSTEGPYLIGVFANNTNVIDKYKQFPGSLGYSSLSFFYPRPGEPPKTFAWMNEPGIFYGEIDGAASAGNSPLTQNTHQILFSHEKMNDEKPLACVRTEFHILVLFQDRLRAFCTLYKDQEKQLVLEDVFAETYGSGNMVGMTKDAMKGTIWVYSDMAIYRYKVIREDRHVWEAYLSLGEYDLAKKYCKDDAAKLDKVLTKQAEDCFNKEQYEASAELFAKTHFSFEEVTLKFMQAKQEDSLKLFLWNKLRNLKPEDKTQITMLVLWLLEIYLTRIGTQRHESAHQKTDEHKRLQAEFHTFLTNEIVHKCLIDNKEVVCNLIASHGDEENLIHFAVLMKDYKRVIRHHLQHKNYTAALDVLSNQSQSDLFYQFSPALMQAQPEQTAATWIAQGKNLNPIKLIPAMVQDDISKNISQGSYTLRYLEFVIYDLGYKEESIHNYLLALYAQLKSDRLMKYLTWQGQDPSCVNYDLKYALRLCSDLKLDRACVHICSTMGLYEEAVNLALKFDIDLAKQNADKPDDNEELRKKLWLQIACHVVNEDNDIKKAMDFLHECDLLKIEDILPFFPNFVTINHFKEAICSSLQVYNQHIEGLKNEMEEATQSAQEIRNEIHSFRKKYAVVAAEDKCCICSYGVMSKPFYLFPCRHLFHTDCLIVEVFSSLTPQKGGRVVEIQRHLEVLAPGSDTVSISSSGTGMRMKEQLLVELDDLIASECPYCGDLMIRRVDAPFIEPEEYSQVLLGWE